MCDIMTTRNFLLSVLLIAVCFPSCGNRNKKAVTNDAPEEIALFNGKNLDGWGFVLENDSRSTEEVFSVRNGVIHIEGTPFGYMYTQEKFDDFKLNVEWRWPEEATNSGIFLFVQDDFKVWPKAIECQLCAGDAGDFVLLSGSDMKEFVLEEGQKRPAFPVVKKAHPSNEKPVGEWNTAEITCENGKVTVLINGTLQNTGTATLHKSGRIALQSEGKDIQFRNIVLTKL